MYTLPLKQATAGVLDVMWGFKKEPGCKVWKCKYRTVANIALKGSNTFRIIVGYAQKKTYCQIDFKPAEMSQESWELFNDYMSLLFPHGYDSLYHHGRVSYLEIAIDCTGVDWPGFLPFDSALRNSAWWPLPTSPKPTAYLGSRGSNRIVRVYDRVERLKTNGIAIDGPVTRVEVTLRKLNCSIPELESIKNPFLTVGICSNADAEMVLSLPGWKKFLNHCKTEGAPIALSLAGPQRQPFLQKLESMNCDWWDPQKCWGGYKDALSVLTPAEPYGVGAGVKLTQVLILTDPAQTPESF